MSGTEETRSLLKTKCKLDQQRVVWGVFVNSKPVNTGTKQEIRYSRRWCLRICNDKIFPVICKPNTFQFSTENISYLIIEAVTSDCTSAYPISKSK